MTATAVCTGLMWGEAIKFHDGTLWASDTQAGQLVSVRGSDEQRRPLDSPTNGTWFLPDGRLAVARWEDKRIDVMVGEEFEPYADLAHLVRGMVGDMTGAPNGRLYLDDMGPNPHNGDPVGRILAVDPDGSARIAADGLRFPNGLAVIGDTLIVAETHGTCLTAFDIVGDEGLLENRRVWADLAEMFGERYRPDGLWAASDGSVWVATTTGEKFVRIRGNEVIDHVATPGEFAITCCLDGTDLYISAAHSTDPRLDLLTEALPEKKVSTNIYRVTVSV